MTMSRPEAEYDWPIYTMDEAKHETREGLFYYYGIDVVESYFNAVECFMNAAQVGDMEGLYCLGVCYISGRGIEESTYDAVRLWRQAESNDYALFALGICVYNGWINAEQYGGYIFYFELAADMGNPFAQYHLGNCFKKGIGVPQDITRSIELFQRAATENHTGALNSLADYFETGDGVAKDIVEGFELYKRAAYAGNAAAEYNVAICYETGTGIEEDLESARYWYEMAANQGLESAMFALEKCRNNVECKTILVNENSLPYASPYDYQSRSTAEMNEYGCWYQHTIEQTRPDEQPEQFSSSDGYSAIMELQKDAETGDLNAELDLANAHFNGKGTPYNHKLALYWYEKAAEEGSAEAMNSLANCREYGKQEVKSFEEAFLFYQEAAKLGHVKAEYNVGRCYKFGIGTQCNLDEAIQWFELAAAENHKKAAEEIEQMADSPHIATANPFIAPSTELTSMRLESQIHQEQVLQYDEAVEKEKESDETDIEAEESGRMAFQKCQAKAIAGDAAAEYELANRYYNGFHVEKNYNTAYDWYERSAEEGNLMAINELGYFMEHGFGKVKDLHMAIQYYQQAIAGGYSLASKNLERCQRKLGIQDSLESVEHATTNLEYNSKSY